jgi:RNA polymerase sigma-70 factor (ECF subfamily)
MSGSYPLAVQVAGSPWSLDNGFPAALRSWLSTALSPEAAPAALATPATDSAGRGTAVAAPVADPADSADVQASLGGDQDAYARLVRRHQQTIGVTMWRFTRQRQQWEELVHDVFVEAYLGLNGYQGRAPFSHWLRRIATRVGYRYWKGRRRRERELPLDESPDAAIDRTEAGGAQREAAETVHGLLAQLAPRDRLVITLMYLEQCSVTEIAGLTGWSESLVKVQAFRARRRLRRLWEARGETP